jgi:hypothetical protein
MFVIFLHNISNEMFWLPQSYISSIKFLKAAPFLVLFAYSSHLMFHRILYHSGAHLEFFFPSGMEGGGGGRPWGYI